MFRLQHKDTPELLEGCLPGEHPLTDKQRLSDCIMTVAPVNELLITCLTVDQLTQYYTSTM